MAWLRTILVLVPLLTSCASFSLGWQLGSAEGRTINAASQEGADLLHALYEVDGGARDVQAEYGDPDYVGVEGNFIYFFYVKSDTVVVLESGGMRVNSAVSALSPIPENFLARLSLASRSKIEQSRSSPARSAAE